jgi:hypothetical protein
MVERRSIRMIGATFDSTKALLQKRLRAGIVAGASQKGLEEWDSSEESVEAAS